MRKWEGKLKLLPPESLLKTGEVDHADWNYRPLLGTISRTRFELVVALLDGECADGRLLEVGYGSGVFLPELARHCAELYGIDIHQMNEEVGKELASLNLNVKLFSGGAAELPFAEKFFDCVVAVSALEFVVDLEAACVEIARVLKLGGHLIVITPGHSPLVDFGLKMLTRESAERDFGDRRQSLIPTLLKHFDMMQRLTVPAVGSSIIHLYTALKLRPRGAGDDVAAS